MRTYNQNLARKDTEETFPQVKFLGYPKAKQQKSKESLPNSKILYSIDDVENTARSCLTCTIIRQKAFAAKIDVCESQIAKWASGEKIPFKRANQIIDVWEIVRRSNVTPIDEKIAIYHENLRTMIYGPNVDAGKF